MSAEPDVQALDGVKLSDDEDSIGLQKNNNTWESSSPNLRPNLTDIPKGVDINFVLMSEEKGSIQSKLQETEEQLTKIQVENQKLQSEKEQVEFEKTLLRKTLASSPRAVDDMEHEEMIDIRDRFSESRKEVKRLKQRIEELEHEVATNDSRQTASQLKIDRQHKKEIEELKKEVKKLTKELSQTKKDLLNTETDLEIANSDIEELEEKVEAFKTLYDESRENYMSSQTESTDEMTKMLEEHMQAQADLMRQREELEFQYNELERRHKELEERDDQNVMQIQERSGEVVELQRQIQAVSDQNDQLMTGFEKMLEEKRQLKEIIASLEEQVMEAHENAELWRMENEEQSEADIQAQSLAVKDLQAQKERLQRQIAERDAEIRELNHQAELKDSEQSEFVDIIAELQDETTGLKRHNSELKVKLSRLNELETLKSELGKKEAQFNEIQEELVSVKDQYDTLVASKLSLICNISNNIDSMREDLIAFNKLQSATPRTIVHRETFADWIQTKTEWIFTSIS